jgi:pSer/pThr/pTyr-binding forkhead associated (FHA) protein
MGKRFSLGRADAGKADVLLAGSTISAKHAKIYIDDRGALLISDLGSSNGTTIIRNGKVLSVSSSAVSVHATDVISLGGKKFTVDEILAKQPTRQNAKQVSNEKVHAPEKKMIRCPSCGSVTPVGMACVECGYIGG